MHRNSLLLFDRYARSHFKPGTRVLEIGPDVVSEFERKVADPTIKWETIDIFEHPRLTYTAKGLYEFPIPDQTFDVVFSAQVLEHVKAVWRWIREVARVCKSGGVVITINPVNWGYHEVPVDCWRVYPEGMRALYDEGGLNMELCKYESLESAADRMNWKSLKWVAKKMLGRPNNGEPFFPVDTISIGRRP